MSVTFATSRCWPGHQVRPTGSPVTCAATAWAWALREDSRFYSSVFPWLRRSKLDELLARRPPPKPSRHSSPMFLRCPTRARHVATRLLPESSWTRPQRMSTERLQTSPSSERACSERWPRLMTGLGLFKTAEGLNGRALEARMRTIRRQTQPGDCPSAGGERLRALPAWEVPGGGTDGSAWR